MTSKDKAKSIIHSASAAAGSVALSPIPFTGCGLVSTDSGGDDYVVI